MGKNSRRRHVDKQRQAAERRRRQEAARSSTRGSVAADDQPDPGESNDDSDPVSDGCRQAERVLGFVLRDRMWTHGWQPAELLRQIRRTAGVDAAEVLAMAITADTAHHDRVGNVIHDSWRRQTELIAGRWFPDPSRDGWLARWLDAAGAGVSLTTVRILLERLLELRGLPRLIAPPGWTGGALVDVDSLVGETAPSPKLETIRGLLAKAESTEFPAEAEAFTAKAQAMMTEARVDEARVRATSGHRSTGHVAAVRLAIDEPYVASKQSLLHVIADANDVRCVFHRGVDLATLVGPVGQLGHVELLFTSLLIQVQSALAADSADALPGSQLRSRRYRSSFIVGFAERIGERLRETRDATIAASRDDALPILAEDDRATAELFERLVGRTTRFRSSTTYDAIGLVAGSSAADRATLREAGVSRSASGTSRQLRDAS